MISVEMTEDRCQKTDDISEFSAPSVGPFLTLRVNMGHLISVL